jgi:hypothetical protein
LTSYNRCQNIRTFPLKETFIKIWHLDLYLLDWL